MIKDGFDVRKTLEDERSKIEVMGDSASKRLLLFSDHTTTGRFQGGDLRLKALVQGWTGLWFDSLV